MNVDPALLKWGGLGCCAAALAGVAVLSIGSPAAPMARFAQQRTAALDARLRSQLLPARGRIIFLVQLLTCLTALCLMLATKTLGWLWCLPLIAVAPTLVLSRMQHARKLAIEARIDAFTMAFANALRATPNIARALETVATSTAAPLREELDLTLRELRVGSTLDQALGELGLRISSTQFDATLSALLIGKRIGGDVPAILNDTANSLREMMRLQAVLRAKTADGRVQGLVLAAFPVLIVFAFDLVMPGYFDPLTTTPFGALVLLIVGGCWISALVLMRRLLMVQL